MAILDILNGVLSGLAPQLTSSGAPQPGELVSATIANLPDDLEITDILQGDIDLTLVNKDVLYGNSDLEAVFSAVALNQATTGAKPITGATGIIPGIGGVPGLLGQLKGKIPFPMQARLPVQVTVTWAVLSDGGEPLDSGKFVSPTGLSQPAISIAFAPEVTELTDQGVPAPVRRKLRATVTLAVNGVSTPPRQLPDLPILVPALPIPTVLAMFVHTNFNPRSGDDDGATLLVVPASSPLRSLEQIQGVLNTLQGVICNLQSFAGFASFLLGLSDLTQAVSVSPHVQFRATNKINNLNDITLIQNSWYENDIEAEDELSSLILIGPTGRGVTCCNDRDLDRGEGQFTVTTTENMVAIIRDLDGKSPTVELGAITVDVSPPGGIFNADKFNDELSSIEFIGDIVG